jgi:hypothetical protein
MGKTVRPIAKEGIRCFYCHGAIPKGKRYVQSNVAFGVGYKAMPAHVKCHNLHFKAIFQLASEVPGEKQPSPNCNRGGKY